MISEKLIMFVKAPLPGVVKTRLAKTIGAEAAASAYRILVETLLRQLQSLNEVELRFTPDDEVESIRPWLRAGWQAQPQGAGDLGQRLDTAFKQTFSARVRRAVVIGSDCPEVTPDDLNTASAALRTRDVVLGPAADGGYWLIGLRHPQPSLFERIEWGTSKVLIQTMQRARESLLTVHLLRELRDVDTADDWRAFLATQNRDGIVATGG